MSKYKSGDKIWQGRKQQVDNDDDTLACGRARVPCALSCLGPDFQAVTANQSLEAPCL
jgi:hypothetical protein